MLSGTGLTKRFLQSVFVAGILISAPTWATDVVGTVKSAVDSSTVIPNATVILTSGFTVRDTVITDVSGNFDFPGMTAGNKTIAVSATGFFPASVTTVVDTTVAADTVKVYLALPVVGTITGKISAALDSTVITGAVIYLRRGSATAAVIDSQFSDASGNYTFTNVAPGTPNYYLTVIDAGFINGTRTNLAVPNGGTATSNFFLQTPGSITGLVKSAADSTTAIRGVLIVRRRGSANGTPIDSATTNSSGAYTFNNVTPGTPNYWLTATSTGYLTTTNANVVVANGLATTSNFYLTVAVPSSIQGVVYSSADSTTVIANAWLYLRRGSATAAISDSTQSIADGEYAFGNVSPGTPNYWITATADGYAAATRANLSVPNSSTVTTNIYMSLPGTITGTVVDTGTGGPIPGEQIILRRGSATSAGIDTTVTDLLGNYIFSGLVPGTPNYWVTAGGNNYSTVTIGNVALAAGATASVNFDLTLQGDAVFSPATAGDKIHFIRMGNQLALYLGASNSMRTVEVYSLSGVEKLRVSIPAGVTRAMIPAAYAPENGFLFKIK